MQASSIPTGSTLPGTACLRSVTNVAVFATTRVDRSVQPHGRVDRVRQEVACYTRSCDLGIQTPQRRAALRHVGRDGPVLQVRRPVMIRLADAAFVNELLRQRNRRERGGS